MNTEFGCTPPRKGNYNKSPDNTRLSLRSGGFQPPIIARGTGKSFEQSMG